MAKIVSIHERISDLVRVYGNGKNTEFAELLGINEASLRGYRKNVIPKSDFLEKVARTFDINLRWLLTGEGDMMADPVHFFETKCPDRIDPDGYINLYDVEASANLKTLFDNKDQNILGQIHIPNIPKCDGAVYVKGDSMYPLLKSGDIVAYKEIPLDMQHIFFGEMYLVSIDLDGDEYLTVKYVQHSDKGDDWIQLVSHNPHHQPKDFPLSSVRAMALVKLSIRMNTMK